MIWNAMGDSKRGTQPPELLDQVHLAIRARHYGIRTEKAYVAWIKQFSFFHGKRHPMEMEGQEVNQFLTDLLHSAAIRGEGARDPK